MSDRILFIHYTPPGVIGGVEHVMHQHAHLLDERGYRVEIVAGRASELDLPVHVIPEVETAGPAAARVEAELDAGVVSPRFYELRSAILAAVRPLVDAADVVVVHNAFTLHFNLALTSVMWELAARRSDGSVIAWCHDLSWTNSLYLPRMHAGYPWNLLRLPAPAVGYVTVSRERRDELAALWGEPDAPITVVPNGIDADAFFRLSDEARDISARYRLFDRDVVLLLPVRITRRKNIEAAICAVRRLKDRGLDVRFLISGPQAPHHPGRSDAYLQELMQLRADLGVVDEVVFVARDLGRTPTSRTVAELFALTDVLILPSAQEGFGLPILEAGLARVPAVLSNIRIFREVGGDDTWVFDLSADADTIAGIVLDSLDSKPSRLYRRVLRQYRWDAIVDRLIVPLLDRGNAMPSPEAVPE
jgi:glycosyltransferase involved in cell wall biosynthesis